MIDLYVHPHQSHGIILFPWKLHQMLRDCDRDGKSDIVSWLPPGNAFKVHKVSEFVDDILPSYFKQSRYKSFQRQLNLWGFERITTNGPEKGAYCHPQFLQDKPSLCRHLSRQRAKRASPPKLLLLPQAEEPQHIVNDDMDVPSLSQENIVHTTRPLLLTSGHKKEQQEQQQQHPSPITTTSLASSVVCYPALFEGCPFFPLEMDRCEELTLQVSRISSGLEPDPNNRRRHSALNLLQELEEEDPKMLALASNNTNNTTKANNNNSPFYYRPRNSQLCTV